MTFDPLEPARWVHARRTRRLPRTGPGVLLLVRAAAGIRTRREWDEIRAERVVGMTMNADNLPRRREGARHPLGLHRPELYEMLVLTRRWLIEQYGTFLAEARIAALLPAYQMSGGAGSGLTESESHATF
ncbi:MAG TPA: hypothetical protein VIW24_06260 [Aldersonia sp.]